MWKKGCFGGRFFRASPSFPSADSSGHGVSAGLSSLAAGTSGLHCQFWNLAKYSTYVYDMAAPHRLPAEAERPARTGRLNFIAAFMAFLLAVQTAYAYAYVHSALLRTTMLLPNAIRLGTMDGSRHRVPGPPAREPSRLPKTPYRRAARSGMGLGHRRSVCCRDPCCSDMSCTCPYASTAIRCSG